MTDSLNPSTYNDIASLIEERFGLYFRKEKEYYLKKRIKARMEVNSSSSPEEYYQLIDGIDGTEELNKLIEELVVRETSFFRNTSHFNVLRDRVVPELIKDKKGSGNRYINIWSAGCCSGEETYSIAMIVLSSIEFPLGWKISVVGTDISKKALDEAIVGQYNGNKTNNIPPDLFRRYMEAVSNNTYVMGSDIKNIVGFHQQNLVTDVYPQNLDLIFCRNVIIYERRELKKRIIGRFYRSLRDGGYLFLGHSESIRGLVKGLEPVYSGNTVYYKKAR